MERLVPPHAPVGPLNGCVLPIRWEFPRYTSFQSWRQQKRSFIFLLKSITNLEWGVEESVAGFLTRGVFVCRKRNLFRWVLWSWWHFSTNWRLFLKQKTWELKQTCVLSAAPLPLLPSELTDRRQLQLPCLTALFRGLWKLPSSLFLKLNVWLASQRMSSAHQRIKHAQLKMQKDEAEKRNTTLKQRESLETEAGLTTTQRQQNKQENSYMRKIFKWLFGAVL